MNKVLLVDDEVFVCKGLRGLIDWEEIGFEICGEANNGEDAFSLIMEIKPDVVITDIKMPAIDGLQLIKSVKQNLDKDIIFIIISGYNDFSYAQQAVRYGVFDFILKPIDNTELEVIMEKLRKKLEADHIENSRKEKMVFEQLMVQLLDGSMKESEARELSQKLKIDTNDYFYYVILEMNNIYTMENTSTSKENSHFFKKIINDTLLSLTKTSQPIHIYEQQDHAIGLLITSNYLDSFNGDIEVFVDELKRKLKQKTDRQITICVGAKVLEVLSLKQSYETANSVRGYKYIRAKQETILYSEVENIPVTYNELDKSIYLSLMEHIEEKNIPKIKQLISDIFYEFETNKFKPAVIYTTINRFVHNVIQTINKMGGNEGQIPSLPVMIKWERYNLTKEELKNLFSIFILEGATIIQDLRKENIKGDIYKIKDYVDKNFHKNISLKSIANEFYMNPVYMGQLFKKTFGIYFKEYLLKLRITESKKLLRQTDARIYEVAEKVGFGSTDYFITQFEKITNATPTEYRNKLLKK
ncbi:response regulator transcription factor [Aquibacillus albus]|uniref:Two-component system response regulator YesN n=1 Tax=Aquibacillus albus TaxID=1168171 RepID=A0ABS2MWY6_9BACI|nr:response regulator transcription factor [Aquibacillus albus]MBM7570303.1 two-component system response regulator YesN [Aquibacillus albus]